MAYKKFKNTNIVKSEEAFQNFKPFQATGCTTEFKLNFFSKQKY